MDTSTEKYTAFISYRHKPLDTAVAEELIKLIEHYRVPKDLRRDGSTSLGKVFRDRDELGVYHDLNAAIYPALDNSDFLIVICSPDTKESQWVHLEIQRFLQTHTREQILVVHVAGTAEEAIPEQITHVYDENGLLIKEENPLSIYLVDHNEKKVLSNLRQQFLQIAAALMRYSYDSLVLQHEYSKPRKRLKKEILRLLAALLNCPYDALEQRNKKYLYQRLMIMSLIAASFLMVFMLVVIGKNHRISLMNLEIQEKNEQIAYQLLQTQINESKALTSLSSRYLESGDRINAVESALNALPHDGDGRPYYPPAENALAKALNIYRPMQLDYSTTLSQAGEICHLALSDDGQKLVTLDVSGVLRCFDLSSYTMLWESNALQSFWRFNPVYSDLYDAYTDHYIKLLEILGSQDLVIYSDIYQTYAFSLKTGHLLHNEAFCTERLDSGHPFGNTVVLSPDKTLFLQYSRPDAMDVGLDDKGTTHYIEVYETATFRRLWGAYYCWPENWDMNNPAFSPDGTMLALPFSGPGLELLVLDTQTWQAVYQEYLDPAEGQYVYQAYPVWLPDNQLILTYQQRNTSEEITTYFEKYDRDWSRIASNSFYCYLSTPYSLSPSHYLSDSYVYYTLGSEYLYTIDPQTLQRTSGKSISLAGVFLWQNSILAVEHDGTVSRMNHSAKKYTAHYYQPDKQIRIAQGLSGDQKVLCMVPESAPDTVIVALTPHFQESILLEAPTLESDGTYSTSVQSLNFWISPSRNSLFSARPISAGSKTSQITEYDLRTLAVLNCCEIEELDFQGLYLNDFSGFSADERKLIFRDLVYDRTTASLTQLEDGNRVYGEYKILVDHPPFYTQPQGAPLLSAYRSSSNTLYLWTDGTDLRSVSIPYEMDTYNSSADYANITSIGHNGLYVQPLFSEDNTRRTSAFGIYSIHNKQWKLMENPVARAGFPVFAIGSTQRQVAFAHADRTLQIYDYDQNAIIRSFHLAIHSDSIRDMQYIGEDQYLMISTRGGQFYLMDTISGSILVSHTVDVTMIPIIIGDSLYLTNTKDPVRVSLETGDISAQFDNVAIVLSFQGRETLLCTNEDQLLALPVRTWEELAEIGSIWLLKTGNRTS